MAKDILIPHADLQDPQTITERTTRAFREADVDIHRHEVDAIDDDFKRGVRRLKVRHVKYFDLGRR